MFKLFLLCLFFYYLIKRLDTETFIPRQIRFTNIAINPLIITTHTNNYIDNKIAQAIQKVYPLISEHSIDIISSINTNKKNIIGIDYTVLLYISYYIKGMTKIRSLFDIYDDYFMIISFDTNKIIIAKDIKEVYVLNTQSYIISDFITTLLSKDIKIVELDNINSIPKSSILCLLDTEMPTQLTGFTNRNLYFITPPNKTMSEYMGIQYTKMSIANINCQNIERVISTYKFTKSLFTNSNTELPNFINTIFINMEYIRRAFSSKFYTLPLQSFTKERLTYLSYIPNSDNITTQLKNLNIITNKADTICTNVIGSVECVPEVLNSNRYRLLNMLY